MLEEQVHLNDATEKGIDNNVPMSGLAEIGHKCIYSVDIIL